MANLVSSILSPIRHAYFETNIRHHVISSIIFWYTSLKDEDIFKNNIIIIPKNMRGEWSSHEGLPFPLGS